MKLATFLNVRGGLRLPLVELRRQDGPEHAQMLIAMVLRVTSAIVARNSGADGRLIEFGYPK